MNTKMNLKSEIIQNFKNDIDNDDVTAEEFNEFLSEF
ncbi:MAG: hypothetical protein CM15mP102_14660 [Flavobacteriales bacterium]|nr:MAG: hypothetical protein CM15mP102_14660 [Flavobacteriales bacterium]